MPAALCAGSLVFFRALDDSAGSFYSERRGGGLAGYALGNTLRPRAPSRLVRLKRHAGGRWRAEQLPHGICEAKAGAFKELERRGGIGGYSSGDGRKRLLALSSHPCRESCGEGLSPGFGRKAPVLALACRRQTTRDYYKPRATCVAFVRVLCYRELHEPDYTTGQLMGNSF